MNKVILIGRFTKDPELKYTSGNNTAICNFTLAVDKRFQKQGEEKKADFIGCQAWEKTAEFIVKHFQKGSKVSVVGRIQTRTWDDTEGKKHYVTEVIVEETYFVEGKKESVSDSTGPAQVERCEICGATDGCDCELPF
jgi:single-strand DNA-binding protein